MSASRENSFGAKITKAQELAAFIAQFPNYEPLREEESAASFRAFLTQVQTNSDVVTKASRDYKEAVDQRQFHYKESPTSVTKILPQIKAAVEALYGKKSSEATTINGYISEMRNSKVIKIPAVQSLEKDTIKAESTFSMSQQSYGSQLEFLNRIVKTLEQYPTYKPVNKDIKLEALQNFIGTVQNLNINVASKLQPLKDGQMNRVKDLAELQDRIQRIKQSVKAQYGLNSNEYKSIKGL